MLIDHFGGVVRLEGAALNAAAQALALELRVDAVQGHHDHVVRYAIDGDVRAVGLGQAAGVDRFVVTGDQAVGVVFARAHAVDVQLGLEKVAHLGAVARYFGCCRAGIGPYCVALEAFAGAAPGFEAGQQITVADLRQVFPGTADVGGERVRLGFFRTAAVAAGEQRQYRE
ncbi:hypothetical protein D3C79_785420 [compost metagenome]